ncbi:pyrrolo-quinoline quinone [Sorangium cellulosum]|uniref:Pyrrolo-quinoline quinone n=1 Tax=Sorangium cellulosum TaxID=56 RepID=A0A2L0F8A8_SORCE|nr:PQQ-binding-like beta-propeller repeat protein [Sorangium cellulosum]AUX47752.1 pyrrolo-quinoline quinone [Sorangium cellulosum]
MKRIFWGRPAIVAAACLATLYVVQGRAATGMGAGRWTLFGKDIVNTRHAAGESDIGPANVASLSLKWAFTTTGNVPATPAVDGHAVYFPDGGGNLYKLDAETGVPLWTRTIAGLTGTAGAISRTSPALHGHMLFLGTQAGAHMLAVDSRTGDLLWKTQLDPHPAAIVTQSPVVHGGRVYVGVSSREELFAADNAYPCCTFRGSVVALDAVTGELLWKRYMVPPGYSGGAVWGGAPAIDLTRRALYMTTGNNYTVPPSVAACAEAAGDDLLAAEACLAPDDYIDAMLALDLDTGALKWARRLQGFDAWTGACYFGGDWCPSPRGEDYDFGTGATLFTAGAGPERRDLVGAGQKSGIFWALDRDDGSVVWSTLVGPGGVLGGIMWGVAVDEARIYVPVDNSDQVAYTLHPSGEVITWGSWSALDPATGDILWQTPDPTPGAEARAPLTVANGVVYAGSMSGDVHALNAATGAVLWSHPADGSVSAGPAVAGGTVYWGSGYESFGIGTPGNTLFAFSLP